MTSSRGRSACGGDRIADAELQADVMRFVAILALCLVGISTLAERAGSPSTGRPAVDASLQRESVSDRPEIREARRHAHASPATPRHRAKGDDMRPQRGASPDQGPVTLPPNDAGEAGPSSGRLPDGPEKMEPAPPSFSPIGLPVVDGVGSIASRVTRTPESADEQTGARAVVDESTEPSPRSTKRGLSLRFESDAALLRMVGRGEAGVFVLAGREVFELDTRSGIEFRPAPAPARMHVITPDTVPALLRAEYDGPTAVTWGVTLPSATLEAMRPYLERGEQGMLVITAGGAVRLEKDDA